MERTAAANSVCPRCGGPFRCGVADEAPCPCTAVQLDGATLAQWREAYTGCLCPACLAAAARPAEPSPQIGR